MFSQVAQAERVCATHITLLAQAVLSWQIPTSTGQRTAAWRVMIVFLFFPLLILKIELCSRWTKYCSIY